MVEIAVRFTFLDCFVEGEERGIDVRAGRAQSAPPPQLGVLPAQEACGTSGSPEISMQDGEITEAGDSPSQPAPNLGLGLGSVGHPELCKRPCVHVAFGRVCSAATACDFCHLHHTHGKWLDKRHRQVFQKMSKVHFLPFALQVLEQKARDAGLRGTEALLSILEDELHVEESVAEPVILPQILRCLRRASFATVAGWAAQKCTEAGSAKVHTALHVLRSQASGP